MPFIELQLCDYLGTCSAAWLDSKRRMRFALSLIAISPTRDAMVSFSLSSRAFKDSANPNPCCLTGVTMCVLWWIWDFLKATSFSEDGPHKRGAPVKYLQGAQGPKHTTSVLSKSCSSGVQILDYFCQAVLDKPTQPMSIFLVQRFGILTVLRL